LLRDATAIAMVVAQLASRTLIARPALRSSSIRCFAEPLQQASSSIRCFAEPLQQASSVVAVAGVAEDEAGTVLTDTILDLAVYSLLFGVVALTVYSLYVTLDESNKTQGGWTKAEVEARKPTPTPTAGPPRLQKGARYDPATDQWTYPTEEERAVEVKSSGNAVSGSNRYERRAEKKQKAKRRKKS